MPAEVNARHVLVAAILAAGGLFFLAGIKSAGGTKEAPVTEAAYRIADQAMLPVTAAEHLGQVMYTAHRYPRFCGGDVTAVIQQGHSVASIPVTQESVWMTAPPSELSL